MKSLTEKDIRRYAKAGESEQLEFKITLPPEHVLAQVVSAFANAAGGVLLVGISDGGEIVGLPVSEAQYTYDRVSTVVRSVLQDRDEWETGILLVAGRVVVYATIRAAPKHLGPVATSRGDAYVRRNATNESLPTQVRGEKKKRPNPGHVAIKRFRVFIAMSFREEEDPALVDYWNGMQRATLATGLPLDLIRLDLKDGDYEISQEVMAEVDRADIVIADFTLNSRNVYFELGYARGRNKRLIQTARKETSLDFDVRNWRTLFYRNATELEQKLASALAEAYATLTGDN